jgi:hypothetical protein
MSDNYKIGLSRSRLFDFQNVVTFVGEYKEDFNEKELQKGLNMLSVKNIGKKVSPSASLICIPPKEKGRNISVSPT